MRAALVDTPAAQRERRSVLVHIQAARRARLPVIPSRRAVGDITFPAHDRYSSVERDTSSVNVDTSAVANDTSAVAVNRSAEQRAIRAALNDTDAALAHINSARDDIQPA